MASEIIIIDENPLSGMLIENAISEEGIHNTVVFDDPIEALWYLQTLPNKPIIILGYQLETMEPEIFFAGVTLYHGTIAAIVLVKDKPFTHTTPGHYHIINCSQNYPAEIAMIAKKYYI